MKGTVWISLNEAAAPKSSVFVDKYGYSCVICMRFCTLWAAHQSTTVGHDWSRTIEMAASVVMTVPGMSVRAAFLLNLN